MINLKYIFTSALLVAAASASQAVSRQQMQKQVDKDVICARQLPSPQYTPCPNFSLKLCRKNQKNLQKPVDKGHTTCYNNQAVSRAQPAATAAGAFTYSLYAVF